MSGIAVQFQPGGSRPPMGWTRPRGYVPPRARFGLPKQMLLVILGVVLLAGGGTIATVAAAPPAPPAVPSERCTPAASAGKLTSEQRANATKIVAVGKSMGIPEFGQIVAVATAMQESSLINLDGGDRDSAGLFQQRPSQGWGSWAQVTNPDYSARTFYGRLQKLKGYERMPVTKAAQTIQRSAYPDAYAKWEPAARSLVTGTKCERT